MKLEAASQKPPAPDTPVPTPTTPTRAAPDAHPKPAEAAQQLAADLQRQLDATSAELAGKVEEIHRLQQQCEAASEAARAAGSEAERLRGVQHKLESMLTDFESEAAAEQARLGSDLERSEAAAAEAAGQLLKARRQLEEAQAQLAEGERGVGGGDAGGGRDVVSSSERAAAATTCHHHPRQQPAAAGILERNPKAIFFYLAATSFPNGVKPIQDSAQLE